MSSALKMEISETAIDKRDNVIRKALTPIIYLLNVFGLYYGSPTYQCSGRICALMCIKAVYAFIVCLLILGSLVKCFVGVYFSRKTDYFIYACLSVYYFKGLAMCVACNMLSPNKKTCKLWSLVNKMEQFLATVNYLRCRKIGKKFARKLRMWLYAFGLFAAANIAIKIFPRLFPNEEVADINKIVLSPLPPNDRMFTLGLFLETLCFGAGILPAALCGMMTQSVAYLFDELIRYLKYKTASDHMCLDTNIKEIRSKYLTLTRLCSELDCTLANIFMFSYLLDVTLICLLLRCAVFSYKDMGRLVVVTWMLPPLFTLLSLSIYSSQIIEKNEEMVDFIQDVGINNVSLDSKVELDLLLFHMNTEPVVMTLWKMIPLYKSIIISIFVSIVTYYALLITM